MQRFAYQYKNLHLDLFNLVVLLNLKENWWVVVIGLFQDIFNPKYTIHLIAPIYPFQEYTPPYYVLGLGCFDCLTTTPQGNNGLPLIRYRVYAVSTV